MTDTLQILVIDDEPVVGDRLKPALEKQNANVEIFTDPRLAGERIKSGNFDIIITDIRMANMNGIEILELAISKNPNAKVIMITGYATMELAREALTKGAFDFIAKPFKIKELRAVINKAAMALKKE